MSISFTNKHGVDLSVCLIWYNTDCVSPPFRKSGWWNIAHGDTLTVLYGPYRNKYFYYYAEAADGAYWGSPNRQISVVTRAFDVCFDTIFEPNIIVPLNEFDTGHASNINITLL